MLAHAKVNIASLVVQLGEIAASLHHGFIGGAQVSTAANQSRNLLSQLLDYVATGGAGCTLGLLLKDCFQGFQIYINLTSHAVSQFCCQLGIASLIIFH